MKLKSLAILIGIANGIYASAQIYDTNGGFVQTFAGSGFSGYVDGVGQQTMFNYPNTIVADSDSNLFVWDFNNYRIRKITPSRTVTTFAGGGGQASGVGTNVSLFGFNCMTIDQSNNIWVALGSSPACLAEITSNATVTQIAFGSSLIKPVGICADSQNNLYIADVSNKIYRYTTNGVLSVFAGSGNPGYADGNGIFTAFRLGQSGLSASMACDQADNVYVWDSGNYLIRKIDQNQNVTTFVGQYGNSTSADGNGTNAVFNMISQMCFDNSGNLFIACGNCIRKISAATNVVTIAGSFSTATGTGYAYTNGAGNLARFNGASGVCMSGGTIYIADSGNQRIRSITNNPPAQVITGANLGIGTFAGVTITGIVGRTYQIQSSPDLNSWTTQATVLLNSSPYLWIDQNPIAGNKFYQAVMLP